MATKKITEFDTHSIAAADYLLFSNAAGTATYKTTLLSLLSNLTLTKETVGFTIAGGTTPKTLTLDTDITASLLTTTSTAILVSNLDTDGTLAANSDTKVPSQKAIKTYVDTNYVAMTGNQTVAGIKTFSSFPVSPSSAPTADYEMANKKYVDDTAFAGVPDATESTPGKAELATQAETDNGTDDERIVTPKKLATTTNIPAGVATALAGKVATSGNEIIAGIKTFGSIPLLPASDPTTDNQATRKAYVDTKGALEKVGVGKYANLTYENYQLLFGVAAGAWATNKGSPTYNNMILALGGAADVYCVLYSSSVAGSLKYNQLKSLIIEFNALITNDDDASAMGIVDGIPNPSYSSYYRGVAFYTDANGAWYIWGSDGAYNTYEQTAISTPSVGRHNFRIEYNILTPTAKFYIDGVLVGTLSTASKLPTSSSNVYIRFSNGANSTVITLVSAPCIALGY